MSIWTTKKQEDQSLHHLSWLKRSQRCFHARRNRSFENLMTHMGTNIPYLRCINRICMHCLLSRCIPISSLFLLSWYNMIILYVLKKQHQTIWALGIPFLLAPVTRFLDWLNRLHRHLVKVTVGEIPVAGYRCFSPVFHQHGYCNIHIRHWDAINEPSESERFRREKHATKNLRSGFLSSTGMVFELWFPLQCHPCFNSSTHAETRVSIFLKVSTGPDVATVVSSSSWVVVSSGTMEDFTNKTSFFTNLIRDTLGFQVFKQQTQENMSD